MTNSFKINYNQSLGLKKLIELAVGKQNLGKINDDITQERFPLAGIGIRKLSLRVEPCLDDETVKEVRMRLLSAGHIPANTGDLASFFRSHPTEVGEWAEVLVVGEDSQWENADNRVCVPGVFVFKGGRYFGLCHLYSRVDQRYGVLVIVRNNDSDT